MAQNIDRLFFADNGKLRYEFSELYDSLFRDSSRYVTIVKVLGQCHAGLTRDEIINKTKIENGGGLSRMLEDLQHCGFIQYVNGNPPKKNGGLYKLTDNFTLFYFKFMGENKHNDEMFWSHNYNAAVRFSWIGLAFERVCFQHIRQIKDALKIGGVMTSVYPLRIKGKPDKGAQIDMLIDRADNTINLCEIKFSKKEFLIDKEYSQVLQNKINLLQELTNFKKTILLTMITTNGIEHNGYWSMVQNEVTSDDLFKE